MTDQPTLVLETSTPCASVALIRSDEHSEHRAFTGDRSHNAALFAPLKELFGQIDTKTLGLVLVGSGPGSYSGTRVGIAAAQGIAIACGCPAVTVPSVLAVPSADLGASCVAIGDARRGGYWTAEIGDASLKSGPDLTDAAGLVVKIQAALHAGKAVFSFEEPTRFPLHPELGSQIRLEFPDATRLWTAWKSVSPTTRARWQAEPPQPIYLKPPHITPAKKRAF